MATSLCFIHRTDKSRFACLKVHRSLNGSCPMQCFITSSLPTFYGHSDRHEIDTQDQLLLSLLRVFLTPKSTKERKRYFLCKNFWVMYVVCCHPHSSIFKAVADLRDFTDRMAKKTSLSLRICTSKLKLSPIMPLETSVEAPSF